MTLSKMPSKASSGIFERPLTALLVARKMRQIFTITKSSFESFFKDSPERKAVQKLIWYNNLTLKPDLLPFLP
jgi:hypothetical protein